MEKNPIQPGSPSNKIDQEAAKYFGGNLVRLTLQIGKDDTYTSTGETILEAINNLETPDHLKAKGFIRVEVDGKTATKQLNIPNLKRMFSVSGNIRGYVRQIISKHLNLFLQ